MHTFRVIVLGGKTASEILQLLCTRGCYNHLWDIDGEHQKIKGWPFVSTGEIRRYYANRDADFLDKTNSMEETPILMTAGWTLNIYGEYCKGGAFVYFNRNPLCTKGKNPPRPNSVIGDCVLGLHSTKIPHCCDETGKVTCKKHVACNFTCYTRKGLEDHFEAYRAYDCTVPGCKRFGEEKGFLRKDNLTQHMRKVHKRFIPRVETRFAKGGRGKVTRTVIDKLPQDPRLGTFELAGAPSETVSSDGTSAEAAEHLYSGGESSVVFRKVDQDDYEHGQTG